MNKRIIRIISSGLLCLLVFAFIFSRGTDRDIYAVDKGDVEEANKQVEETKNKIEQLNNQLSEVSSNIESVQGYVSELDAAITSITGSIAYYDVLIAQKQVEIDNKNLEINNKQTEIDNAEAELKEAVETEKKQYEDTKKRIQYMYERGEDTFLDTIFNSEDLSELLGNAEYVSSIMAYDKAQLDEMKLTREKISKLLVQLENDKEELESQKAELEGQKQELLALEQNLKEQKLLVDQALIVKESALEQLKNDQEYIESQKAIEEAKLAEQKREAEELLKRWQEEVAKAEAEGMDADEANKRKLEEIGLAGGFQWPLDTCYKLITSMFGPRIHPVFGYYSNHSGIDISGSGIYGQNIYACYPGTVISVDVYNPAVDTAVSKPYGTSVQIDHGAGVVTLYAHMSKASVSVGQTVNAGDKLGEVGLTGAVTGAHLHLTLYIKGVLSDPLPYLTVPS